MGVLPSMMLAACTPGTARNRSVVSAKPLRTACGVPWTAGEPATPKVSTCAGSKPGSTCHRRDIVRIISPADAVSTSASATSTTTRMRCGRPCPVLPRPASFSVSFRSARALWNAGAMPNSRLATIETAAVNASTEPSRPTWFARGSVSASLETNTAFKPAATANPSTPPPSASSRPSVSSCRITRLDPAPSARRMANSRRRAVARASIRLATFTQAMSSTNPTAASSTTSGVRTSPRKSSRNDRA